MRNADFGIGIAIALEFLADWSDFDSDTDRDAHASSV